MNTPPWPKAWPARWSGICRRPMPGRVCEDRMGRTKKNKEDRGSRIEDRVIAPKVILDPRCSILDPRSSPLKGGGKMNSTATNLKLADQDRASNFLNLLSLPYVERTFWRGMAIYALDDPAADVYVVLKGRVKIMRSSPEGARKIVSICYSGGIFGELALAGDEIETRRSDEAVALDTTRVAVIRVADFWGAARRDPSLVRDAMRHLTRRLTEA